LRDDLLARLPDRQHLLNESEDHLRIQAAIDTVFREALIEAKERMAGRDFVLNYRETCLSSANADLLNDIAFAPLGWFRDWNADPAGFVCWWDFHDRKGIATAEELQQRGVWRIENDGEIEEDFAAQAYLEARCAFLLREVRLDAGHWLMKLVQVISPEQIQVHHGKTLYSQDWPPLNDGTLSLTLVDTLGLGLEGESGTYPVHAVRHQNMLYLTPRAKRSTRLVSDYMDKERYDAGCEAEDARCLETFIEAGSAKDAGGVINALLPDALRREAQAILAGAIVRLVFDEKGKLDSVVAQPIDGERRSALEMVRSLRQSFLELDGQFTQPGEIPTCEDYSHLYALANGGLIDVLKAMGDPTDCGD
jgi:hypothetical protein